jgi:hypothetical protein
LVISRRDAEPRRCGVALHGVRSPDCSQLHHPTPAALRLCVSPKPALPPLFHVKPPPTPLN